MRCRFLRALVAASAALLGGLVTGIPDPAPLHAQATRTPVLDVFFEGNETFPDDSLAAAIVTRETSCRSPFFAPFCWLGADFAIRESFLPRAELPRDRLRLEIWYRRRGFRETAVDTTIARGEEGVRVGFQVQEGRPVQVDSVEFFGAADTLLTEVVGNLPLQPGDRLSTLLLDASRDTLVRRLADRGYAQAEVLRSYFIPNDDPYSAQVTYDMAPGPRARYGHISVEGEEDLSEGTILRTLQFRDGDVYRRSQLTEGQARLFGLEIVRSASVTPLLDEMEDGVVPVRVVVREQDPRWVRAGGGLSSAECLDVEARWVSRNFQGGGRRLQLRGRLSNVGARQFADLLCWQSGTGEFGRLNWLVSADFDQPWIFSTRNSFRASLFGERQSLPDAFIREAVGLDMALTRNIGPRTPLTLSYAPELSRLDAAELLFCTSFLVCTPRDVDALQGANWLAPVGVNFTRNQTDNLLNPGSGYTLSLDLEHASTWTGSNFRFDRVVAGATWYERLGLGGTVLAAGIRAGWVGAGAFEELTRDSGDGEVDVVHPQKRFFAGGANSVRGFGQNRLGPRVLTIDVPNLLASACAPEAVRDLSCDASSLDDEAFFSRPTGGTELLEGSVELRTPVSGTFQLAAFADFGRLSAERLSTPSLEVTPGVGVRYLSPIGPLRLDLAYRFQGGEELRVVTTQIEAYDPEIHASGQRISVGDERIPWVSTSQLAILGPRVLFGQSDAASWSRLQLHLSIGQAF